jgi:pre-mRNA-processing factor SLU7
VLIEQWEQMEEERKQDPNAEPELEKDKDLIENDDDTITFTNRDPKIKTNTKNLRIREDRAKYLQNLDVNSAHYDGKSRSMRENPTPSLEIKDQDFKGDNYMSHTGFYLDLLEQEKFAIEAEEKAAVEINNVAMPSQAELLYRNFKEKKEVLKSGQKTALLAKYGGEENLGIPDEVAFGETEVYVEYDREGRVLKGTSREKKMKSSRYEEDVHVNGHYCVWGSYFHHHFGWGYKCCYSHKKHSECLREEGKRIEIAREYKLMMDKKKEAEDAHEEMIKKQKIVEGEIESPSKSHSAKQGIENQITNSLAQINSIINQKEGDSNQNQNQHQKDTK